MSDSLEIAGHADVCLGKLLLLAFILVLPAQSTVTQHVVEVVWLLVGVLDSDVVYLWVFDVYGGHVEGWTCRSGRTFMKLWLFNNFT